MAQAASADGLSDSLLKIVADPHCISALYEVLGEYCHELRNRLNSLKLSLYLAKRMATEAGPGAEAWTSLEQSYRDVERFIEQVQTICRPMRLAPVELSLGAVVTERQPTWAAWLAAQDRKFVLMPPSEPAVGCFDPTRLTQGLDALASWRSRAGHPGSPVQLRWWSEGEHLRLTWHEPHSAARAAESQGLHEPATLALPILGRVVAAHGGSLKVAAREGFQVCLHWPRVLPGKPVSSMT